MKISRFFGIAIATLGLIFTVKILEAAEPANWSLRPADLAIIQQPQATPPAQRKHRQKQIDLVRPEQYDLTTYPVTDANETHWRKTLWATALLEPRQPYVANALAEILALTDRPNLTNAQIRTVQMAMQIGTQLFLSNPQFYAGIGDRFQKTVEQTPYPEWAGMALSALVQGGLDKEIAKEQLEKTKIRFSSINSPDLKVAIADIAEQINPTPIPPLTDLLNWQILPQQTHLYVLCRPDPTVLCRAVIKDRNGNFVRENSRPNAPIWSVPLLTRSLHGLRWHLTRGNTPQGIYRIEGTMPRSEKPYFGAYGQFPLVKVFLPFESGVKSFVPTQSTDFIQNIQNYQTLLPPSWRGYTPIEQAYWAGQLGRSLIRVHGSGEFPSFFANNSRFPQSAGWNPAIGCLSAKELYNDDGSLKEADMPKILQALSRAGGGQIEGYMVVSQVEGNSKQPISVTEIEAAIGAKK
jgi:hypothetical protein